MHAASVYPEPGSNSPKEARPFGRDLVRGSDRSHILTRISCHSSIVKVQLPSTSGDGRCTGPKRQTTAAPASDRARLDQQDESRRAEPAEERQLDARRSAD